MPVRGTITVCVEGGGAHAQPQVTPEAVVETNGRPAGALARQVLVESPRSLPAAWASMHLLGAAEIVR